MTTIWALEPGPTIGGVIRPPRGALVTRRTIGYALGLLWLLDGALQLQSYMFTTGFARRIIAPTSAGQPFFVATPVHWNAALIATHPAPIDAVFAGVQLILGVGLFVPRFRRPAIVASVAWAGGVWYLGESLGGLAGGHVTALLGAPGAAALYLLLALAAWPSAPRSSGRPSADSAMRPPPWIGWAWGILWIGFALLDVLPGNSAPSTVAGELTANAASVPGWLGSFDRWLAGGVHGLGPATGLLLVGGELAVGVLSLKQWKGRPVAIGFGMALAALYWAAGQSFGQLFSAQATDPSTGPLLLLLGLASLGAAARPRVGRSGIPPVRRYGSFASGGLRSEILR